MSQNPYPQRGRPGRRALAAAALLAVLLLFGVSSQASAETSSRPVPLNNCYTSVTYDSARATCFNKRFAEEHRVVAYCAPGFPWSSPWLTRTVYGPWTAGPTSTVSCSFGRAVYASVEFKTPLW